ncbi:MAG TPA: hypothetical protein PLB41_00960 [Rubrivivax sp.]|nr:hypothetical protein [Rubrivivax sp.]HPO18884.1 hypothetical protein [Rubrivivax sp.]
MNAPVRKYLAAALLGAAAAAPAAAQSQSSSSDGGGAGGWQFEAAIYGWFPAISGTSSFPPNGGGPSIDVSMGDVINALKFAFMGNFGMRQGQWGLWTDLVYADFGVSRSGSHDFAIGGHPLPVGISADLNLDLKSWIWTLAGSYRLKDDSEGAMDLLFGARMLDMTNGLSWNIHGTGGNLPPRTGFKEVGFTNWDGIVGLRGRARLGADRTWFIPFYVDVGAGDSRLTWQVNAGIAYQFDWGALGATWRYLDYDFKSGAPVTDLRFSGPVIGASFAF